MELIARAKLKEMSVPSGIAAAHMAILALLRDSCLEASRNNASCIPARKKKPAASVM